MESRMGLWVVKTPRLESESSRHGGRGPGQMLTPTTRSSRRQHAAPFPGLSETPTIDMLPPNYRAPRRLTATPARRRKRQMGPIGNIRPKLTDQAPEFIV